MWDDMPPLVEAGSGQPQSHGTIPPPAGATFLSSGHTPHHAGQQQPPPPPPPQQQQQHYPWGYPTGGPSVPTYPFPSHTSPNSQLFSPQYPHPAWYPQYGAQPFYQPQTMPSPYIPHQPTHSEAERSASHHSRTNSQFAAPKAKEESSRHRSMSLARRPRSPWPPQNSGELSPLFDQPDNRPTIHGFGPRITDMHTPSSTLSYPTTSSSQIRPDLYNDRPSSWRRDFRFKSGLAGVFRMKSSLTYPPSDSTGSARLALHPYLQHDKECPPTIYDLRREPMTLVFRELERHADTRDMSSPATKPPTTWMRLYNSRFPWYIDIVTRDGHYITLGDFFVQLFTALNKEIHKSDYYNDDLDDHDRQSLYRAYIERCRDEIERLAGVKRVDFLRGKVFFEGLSRGKNGMWRLRTSKEKL
ncbi:hypothetical protein ID866_7910 [Astraeus odoratus]|nr:hypothetical protein ID866_7910 [Astraeus odoratus]